MVVTFVVVTSSVASLFGQILGVAHGSASCFCGTLAAALDAGPAAGGRSTGGRATTTSGGALGLAGLHDLETGVVETSDNDGDVAGALVDAVATAPSTRREPLQRRALVGEASLDEQLVGILLVVVLCVGDGRRQHLANVVGHLTVAELQHLVGTLHRQPANQVQHDAGLVGRYA